MLFLHVTHLTVQKNRRERRAAESAAAHRLLGALIAELHLPPAPMRTTSKGRPYLEGLPFVDFSLAHTKGLAVCALAHQPEGAAPRVGVDAEGIVTYSEAKINALAARFFGEHERAFVARSTDKATAFTEVFTRKEAYAKYTGEGLGKHWGGTDTLHPDFEHTHGVRFFAYLQSGITVCLCTSESEEAAPPCIIKE